MKRLFWKNFFSLLLAAVAVAQWSCGAWLLAGLTDTRLPAWAQLLGPLAVYVANRAIVARPLPPPGLALRARRVYTAVAFTSLFGAVFLALTTLLSGLAWTGLWVAGLGHGELASAVSDVTQHFGTVGLLSVGGAMAYGYGLGQRRVWVNRFSLKLAGLPSHFDGVRLLQISDLHLGQFMDVERLGGYVAQINALAPDLIVITGDITDGLHHASETFSILAGLQARLGVFAILGNHDVATGAEEVKQALARYTDFRVLDDEIATIEDADGCRLNLIGLMDRGKDWARGVDSCRELSDLHAAIPAAQPAILLCHRPDLFPHAARLGIGLTLSGHTHGGQLAIALPRGRFATLARFMTSYPRGTFRNESSVLHVNLGLGMTGQPIRLATPREITVITLETCKGETCATLPS